MKNLKNAVKSAKAAPALKVHPVLEFFPETDDATQADLTADIKVNGLKSPILVRKDQIVDGRARLKACTVLGIKPKFDEFKGSEASVRATIIALNLRRRHLTSGQRAMVAAKLAKMGIGDNQHSTDAISQATAAKQLGVSADSIQRAKKVVEKGTENLKKAVEAGELDVANASAITVYPPDFQDELVAKGKDEIVKAAKVINKGKKAENRNARLATIEALRVSSQPLLPGGEKFEVIYADPPWDYLGKADTPYPTMSIRDITLMPVKSRTADNAALFLWCPASLIPDALAVISAWGFEYKTGAVWKKGESGLGSYFRVNHEHLLFAVRGKLPAVPDGNQPASCFEEARGEHSEKPLKAYEMIEAMYPELTKLELFCRGEKREGWEGWGNECMNPIDLGAMLPALWTAREEPPEPKSFATMFAANDAATAAA